MLSMKDAMLKAIKDRRGQGIDLKIILGASEPEDEKSKDLAPDATELDESAHKSGAMGKFLEEEKAEGGHDEANLEQLLKEEKSEEKASPEEDEEMLSLMGGKEDMDYKPRSLAERAKHALMKKMGK